MTTETPTPDTDEPPTLTAAPTCPECKAVYTMQDLVFGHPCQDEKKEMN